MRPGFYTHNDAPKPSTLYTMADIVSLEGPVEIVDGELAIRIPLAAGGAVLAPLAKGIGTIEGEFLKVVIPPWMAERLRIGAGSLVIVDNENGKFTITRSAANDATVH
jgi:hypothetical protein